MDAKIYQPEIIQSLRVSRTPIAATYPAPMAWAGLALQAVQALQAATLFSVEYAMAMAKLSNAILSSSGCSRSSKPPKTVAKPSNWL